VLHETESLESLAGTMLFLWAVSDTSDSAQEEAVLFVIRHGSQSVGTAVGKCSLLVVETTRFLTISCDSLTRYLDSLGEFRKINHTLHAYQSGFSQVTVHKPVDRF
jgi:hypothetical protein